MNKNIVITIKKELRGIIRDKKSLLMMILTPLFIPGFIFLYSYMFGNMLEEDKEPQKYTIGINYQLKQEEKEITNKLLLQIKQYKNQKEMKKAYQENKISAYIEKENENYIIYSNNKNEDSAVASSLITEYLDEYNLLIGNNRLLKQGINPEEIYHNISYSYKELKGTNTMVDMILYLGLTFAMMSITLTAIYGVTDTTAGEKERGTLETFLTFPIKTEELILGKYFAITISGIVTSLICVILLATSVTICNKCFPLYKNTIFYLNPATIISLLLVLISFSFLVTGVCIAIASRSNSYKEAQTALTPMSFIMIIPMFVELMEVKISSIYQWIPVLSHAMFMRQIIRSGMNINDIISMFIIIISTLFYSIILVYFIIKLYKSEKILFSN